MAGKDQSSSPYPLAPANGYGRSDHEEESTAHSKELRKKKRIKCIAYVAAFAVFQTIIILVFVLIFMRIKTPKFLVRAVSVSPTNYDFTNSSFSMQLNVQFNVKNTNFGHFKYQHGVVMFQYKGITVGEAKIEKARAKARSTKDFNATVTVTSTSLPRNSELERDLASALFPITSNSKLDGKMHLIKVFKKKKSAKMDCAMEINIGFRTVHSLECK